MSTPRLQRLSEADLDALIAKLRRQGTKELVLLGSGFMIPASDHWSPELRDKPIIYYLKEPVETLAERLGSLIQLTPFTCGPTISVMQERRHWRHSLSSHPST